MSQPQGAWPTRASTAELLRLAWPLILSNSFWTLQITLDRALLAHFRTEAVAAAIAAALLFWAPFAFFQNTVGYAVAFVAQYTGAGRPERVGPVVGQALWLSIVFGLLFLLLAPLAPWVVALGGHAPQLQALEASYLRCLSFAGLPMLLTTSANTFFTGRGDSRTVLLINAVGLTVNVAAAAVLIFGRLGLPQLGIVGAGWATVAGSSCSAVLALALLFRGRYREQFATHICWRLEWPLLLRLLRFGAPNGVFNALDALGFTVFLQLIGRIGANELAGTSIAFTLNTALFLPMMGVGQAVEVLVGQRLGEDRPDEAARSTWTGLAVSVAFTACVAVLLLGMPDTLAGLFRSEAEGAQWEVVRGYVVVLLRFVLVYCLFDCGNLVFSYALRGAGDTRFVTVMSLSLPWPLMVAPTWAAVRYGWGLYWAWASLTFYIVVLALTFLARFLHGRWRTMRVIEHAPLEDPPLGAVPCGEAGPVPGLAVEEAPAG